MKTVFAAEKVHPVTFAPDCGCNTSDDVLLRHIAVNIRRGLPQVQPYQPNDDTALIVCGGPSLKTTERELIEEYWAGGKVVAVNGAYQWCLKRNIKPSAAVMIDAREFNARFIEEPVPGCKYLLASQCHPAAFDLCEGRETYIWHAIGSGSDAEIAMLDEYYFGKNRYHPVTLGTTIGIRAISLMRMLGFMSMDIFGLDSCWMDDKHHAYEQVENNDDGRLSIWLRPKGRDDKIAHFTCSPWHVKQADDFMQLIRNRGDLFRLCVRGNGLIATIMRTGAEIEQERKEP